MIKQQLQDDVKTAMLAGDAARLETLRGLKSAILYAEVAAGKREDGLSDDDIQVLFAKEAKKRQESADLYTKGGSPERAEKELSEKAIIEEYLPEQMGEDELTRIVDTVIAEQGASGMQAMGAVIGAVKKQVGTSADGGLIAKLVKEKLQ
ncbi:GatB/YqeY domain-containing protein [Candidatus Saccharibacteria bacterium]|nr:GatB/YqeY domain-containing protein [Candidatus Saccharibacteria bacterium]